MINFNRSFGSFSIALATIFSMIIMPSLAQESSNCTLIYQWSNDTIPATTAHQNVYNDIWGYEAEGREYVIMGSTAGTHIFDITDEGQEEEIIFIEGAVTGTQMVHRDFHTYAGYLYTVADEGPSTLQIIDLHDLPNSAPVVYDSPSLIQRAHNIFIDEDAGVLYRCGGNHQLSLYSLEDPTDPSLIINCEQDVDNWTQTVGYVHDIYVEDGVAYCNAGGDGLWVVDFSTPTDPVTLGSLTDYEDQGYNHSGWLHESGNYYALADETHGMRIKILDVSDLSDIQVMSFVFSAVDDLSIPHNLIFEGDFLHVAHYVDGYYVWDLSTANAPQLFAYYDTSEYPHSLGYKGAWGVYPFLSSGKILVSDMQEGLFVLQNGPNNISENHVVEAAIGPNPVSGNSLNLFLDDQQGQVMLSVVDESGKLVMQEIRRASAITEITLPDGLEPGAYILNVAGANLQATTTFIKQ